MAKKLDFFISETGDSTESIVSIGSEIAVIGNRYRQHDHLTKARRDRSTKIHSDQIGSVCKQVEKIVHEMDGVLEFALYKLTGMIKFILIVKGCVEFCGDTAVNLISGFWHGVYSPFFRMSLSYLGTTH
jgi:hypothetical protein